MIKILGLTGVFLTLFGSILLIHSYIALKSMRNKAESLSGEIAFKYIFEMYISIVEHTIKKHSGFLSRYHAGTYSALEKQ